MPRARFAALTARIAFGALAISAPAVSASGCAFESPPSTLEIADIEPREVDVGERLEIIGRGFPVGRPAHVSFRGEAHRAGQDPIRVRVDVEATAESSERVDLLVGEALAGPVCGLGDAATHATFRGELTVAFDPAHAGTAPLVGRAGQVVLDVRPDAPSPLARRRAEDEGRKTLAFLGIQIADRVPATGGILLAGVVPGSRAEGAGLHAGEVLAEVDGVRVGSLADVVPVGGHAATLVVRSALGTDARTVRVSIEGLKTRISPDVVRSGVVVAGALALLFLLLRSSSGSLAWLERRLAGRLRGRAVPRGRDGVRSAVEGWLSALERMEDRGVDGLVERWGFGVLATLAFLAVPASETLLGVDLDVVTPYLLVGSALAALAFVGARDARHPRGAWSLGAAAATTARTLAMEIPGALAVACVVAAAGSLRLADVSRSQGGAPWAWAAFRSPATLAAFLVAAAMAIPSRARPGRAGSERIHELPEDEAHGTGVAPGPGLLTRAAEDASRFAFAGIATAVFLGAWEVPGIVTSERDAWWGYLALGCGLFVAKAWLVALAVGALRRTLPRLPGGSLVRVLARYVAPVLALALAATVGWIFWHPSRGAANAIQLATFGVALAAAAAASGRLFHGATTITARHVDPRV
jgi:NADH-quinone oxidoreductase subunit H